MAAIAAISAVALGQGRARLAAATPVHVRAILIDGQLNQKPVPRLELRIASATDAAVATARTGFDGHVDLELPPGRYTLTTPSGVSFDGQSYSWRLRLTIKAAPLTVTLSNDNAMAPISPALVRPTPAASAALDLEAQFRRLRPAVVTVWSDLGQGSGFIVAVHPDGMAMLLTSDHVIAGARALAVQTDATHKVAAILLSEDPNHDTAALAANLSGAPDVTAAILATAATVAAIPAGAPVFTIGSPHQQAKVLTPGIVGQNDAQGLIASINLSLGNAGGPLFAADGAVIGITAADATGLGRIIRITAANAVLRRAEAKFESTPTLPAALLPVVPSPPYPIAALRQAVRRSGFDPKLYQFSFAGYAVTVATPPLVYWWQTHDRPGPNTNAGLRNRMPSLGEHAPVIWIQVTPQSKPTLSSLFLHSLTSDYTHGHASRTVRRRFLADFGHMELECGGRTIVPISPGRIAEVDLTGEAGTHASQFGDTTFAGLYAYAPGAISPACGAASLTVYGAGKDASPQSHPLNSALMNRIWDDFSPWRNAPPLPTLPQGR